MRSTQNSTSPCSRVIRPILASRPQPPNSHTGIPADCVTAMTLRIRRSCPSVLRSTPSSGSVSCGAIDGEVPVAASDVQRPDNQEEAGPAVHAVREADDARAGRHTAAGNTRDANGAEVAVLPWVDQALHA